MAIGWVTDLTAANAWYATRYDSMSLWAALTDPQKTAALTQAYDNLRFSPLLSLPSSPTATELETLKYAQQRYAAMIIALGEGGLRRESAISQGIASAGIVKESYVSPKDIPTIPLFIFEILEEFKAVRGAYIIDTYRDETDNPAYDSSFDSTGQG